MLWLGRSVPDALPAAAPALGGGGAAGAGVPLVAPASMSRSCRCSCCSASMCSTAALKRADELAAASCDAAWPVGEDGAGEAGVGGDRALAQPKRGKAGADEAPGEGAETAEGEGSACSRSCPQLQNSQKQALHTDRPADARPRPMAAGREAAHGEMSATPTQRWAQAQSASLCTARQPQQAQQAHLQTSSPGRWAAASCAGVPW